MGSRTIHDPNEGIITQIPSFEPTGISRNRYIPPEALERAREFAHLAGANSALVTSYLQNSQVAVNRSTNGSLEVRVTLGQPNEFVAANIPDFERQKSATLATRLLEIAYRTGISSSDVSFNFELGPNAQRFLEQRAAQNNLDPVEFRNRVILTRIMDIQHATTITRSTINPLDIYSVSQHTSTLMRGTVEYDPINPTAAALSRGVVGTSGRGIIFEMTAEQVQHNAQVITHSRQIPQENMSLVRSIAGFVGVNRDELVNAIQTLTVAQQYTGYGTSSINVFPTPREGDIRGRRIYEVASTILRSAYHDTADRIRGDFSENVLFQSLRHISYSPDLFERQLPVQMEQSTTRWINNQARYYNLPDNCARIVFAYTALFSNPERADRFLEYNIRQLGLNGDNAAMIRQFVPRVSEQMLREYSVRVDAGQIGGGQVLLRLAAPNMVNVQQQLAQVDREMENRRG